MKLQTKLIIAFITVVLFMGISQSIIMQTQIQKTFKTYLEQSNFGFMERMKENLEIYYEQTGSWDQVQEIFFTSQAQRGLEQGHGMMMRSGMMMQMMMNNADLLLLDLEGIVIADTSSSNIGMNGLDLKGKTLDLVIHGQKQGTLLLFQHQLQDLEKEFVRSSNLSIIISSLIAAVMAVGFSIWVARKITEPLHKLVKGIKQIASGDKADEVFIPTTDEFHDLGDAFNDMSRQLTKNEDIRKALVADVAHELRTPLSILQGKLESIQEGVINPTEETVLELTDEVYRLNRLVSDLQQLSLAEAGKLPLHKQSVSLKPFVTKICDQFQWLADEKNITLVYGNISEEWIDMDVDRMTQVLVNLIGNALRYTNPLGVVEISTYRKDGSLFLEVADNGPGIPKDSLPFVFDRFYKGDSSRTRNDGGTGLGLSIAKGFVEAHGGTLTVNSEIGKGTSFTIMLS